jgi:chromosomal replication initiator protein
VSNLNINEIWAETLQKLEGTFGKGISDMWFKPINMLSFDGGVFLIELPNEVWLKTVKDRYERQIIKYLGELTTVPFSIEYTLSTKTDCVLPLQKILSAPQEQERKPAKSGFNNGLSPNFDFEGFIEGPSNRFAYNAAKAVVKKMGERANNPYVIFSSPGLGKTHLLHAIGNRLLKEKPNSQVFYMSGEGFVSEFIDSLQKKTDNAFRKKYRSLDCLLMDDIQFVVGKEASQNEFFYTFNSLFDNKKQIVLTSDRTPNQLGLDERLSSRLLSGIVAEIKRPDIETRIAILRQKRDSSNFDVPDDVLAFIAEGVQASIRELEGCLFRLNSFCSIHNINPTVAVAREVLSDILTAEHDKYSVSVAQIKKAVCKHFNVNISDLNSKKKSDSIAWPRQIAMYLASQMTSLSLTEIGAEFNRDHSTVLYAKEKVKQEIDENPFFAAILNKIINDIKAVENP